jgi:hypothetical protein
MEKLNVSVGILSWKSKRTLVNTLNSYKQAKLLEMVNDVKIFFQESTEEDKALAAEYEVGAILSEANVGIGRAFSILAQHAWTPNILFLENDWVCIEPAEVVYQELLSGLQLIEANKADMVKYRHRVSPGDPLYTEQYRGNELVAPKHLFDCCHWIENPEVAYPDQIKKDELTNFYMCSSKYANHTNNPTLFKSKFYLDKVSPFSGNGVDLEGKIDGWWQTQNFTVAHGNGLFTHHRIDR